MNCCCPTKNVISSPQNVCQGQQNVISIKSSLSLGDQVSWQVFVNNQWIPVYNLGSDLVINPTILDEGKKYRAYVTNSCGSCWFSNEFTLHVIYLIITQLYDIGGYNAGDTVTLTVTAQTNDPAGAKFQWQQSMGVPTPWDNIPSSQNSSSGINYTSTLIIPGYDPTFLYRVIVSNACGSITTPTASNLAVVANLSCTDNPNLWITQPTTPVCPLVAALEKPIFKLTNLPKLSSIPPADLNGKLWVSTNSSFSVFLPASAYGNITIPKDGSYRLGIETQLNFVPFGYNNGNTHVNVQVTGTVYYSVNSPTKNQLPMAFGNGPNGTYNNYTNGGIKTGAKNQALSQNIYSFNADDQITISVEVSYTGFYPLISWYVWFVGCQQVSGGG